jgi:hypothetical protein
LNVCSFFEVFNLPSLIPEFFCCNGKGFIIKKIKKTYFFTFIANLNDNREFLEEKTYSYLKLNFIY